MSKTTASTARAEPASDAQEPQTSSPKTILFVMEHRGLTRHYGQSLRLLYERGHEISIVYLHPRASKGEIVFAERLTSACPTITVAQAPPTGTGRWPSTARVTRFLMDCIRYFESHFKEATFLRERAHSNLAGWLRRCMSVVRPFGDRGVRAAIRTLRRIDAAIPVPEPVMKLVEDTSPDLVLVAPLVNFGAPEIDYVKAAQALGISTGCCVPSWDNLTNKGHLCVIPDRVFVWNEPQRDEAVTLHGIPPGNVVVTGAQLFDHWFGWEPARERETFCEEVGLDPGHPFVVFLGSSTWIAPGEMHFVERWIREIRSTEDPTVANLGILIRPHPTRAWRYLSMDFSQLGGNATVWPPYSPDLVRYHTDEGRTEFFESLYHASAAIGVNTSAMVEAGIVGCPTCTILDKENVQGQQGTLHFNLLTDTGGGLLRTSESLEEHARDLGQIVASGRDDSSRSFVESFVRPHGLDRPAAPILADAIEEAAGLPRRPRRRETFAQKALRVLILPWTFLIKVLSPYSRPKGKRAVHPLVRRFARGWISVTYEAGVRGLLGRPEIEKANPAAGSFWERLAKLKQGLRPFVVNAPRALASALGPRAIRRRLSRFSLPDGPAWKSLGRGLGVVWANLLVGIYVLTAWAIWPVGRIRRWAGSLR